MAGNLRLLAFLWLVVACHARATKTTTAPTTRKALTTTTAATTTAASTTTAATTTTAASTTTAATTTTAAPTTTAATTTPAPTTTGASTTTAATTITEEPPLDLCNGNPCGQGSTCQDRADAFVCLCLSGANYNYNTSSCENAKVFPGQLAVDKIKFVNALKDNKSPEFKEQAKRITDRLTEVYKVTTGYANSTVQEFRPAKATSKRSGQSGVIASIEIIFTANTLITTDTVEKTMQDVVACKTCVLAGATFEAKILCDTSPCDSITADCKSQDGSFTCTCNENYIKTNFSERICIACPSGKKAKNSVDCEDCPFGRSGFNCDETWQLVLVIVGSVLGALLLIMLILLPVVALKPSKKRSKKSKNEHSGDDANSAPIKAPLVNSKSSFGNSQAPAVNGSAFGNAGVPRIPRATPTSGWDSRTNLEMTQSNSRQTPTPVGRNPQYDDHNSVNPYSQSRQSSLYGQGRPQNNPYAQNRAQANPYAQNQGHTNPYYVHDDGRRY